MLYKKGCGGYADNSSGAASCTGHGESILKVMLARLVLSQIEQGKIILKAVQKQFLFSKSVLGFNIKYAATIFCIIRTEH